jgi:hypothetical protein
MEMCRHGDPRTSNRESTAEPYILQGAAEARVFAGSLMNTRMFEDKIGEPIRSESRSRQGFRSVVLRALVAHSRLLVMVAVMSMDWYGFHVDIVNQICEKFPFEPLA